MRPWICVAYTHLSLLLLQSSSFILSVKVLSPMLCLLVSLVLLTICLYSKEHNILMHPFHMLGVAGVFGGSLFSAMHGSLVTSSLVRETTETESQNYGYKFGQEEETYNIVAAHGYFGRLIFQYASFNNSRSLHFFLAACSLLVSGSPHLVFPRCVQPERFQLQPVHHRWSGSCAQHCADVLNRAGLGMEVMHERNAHNFPLDLAAAESTPVALTAPAIVDQLIDII